MAIRRALRLAAGLAIAAAYAAPALAASDVSAGPAAAGYVADRECALCHRGQARSLREAGMGLSFASVAAAMTDGRLFEDFDAPATQHVPSERWYRITRRGDGLVFRRWQLDASGRETNVLEQPIDYVMWSDHHSRVYLYRTPSGELFQLPLAWYSQENGGKGGWFMAPGFDNPEQQGVLRRVRRECMFCHNAYPDVPAGSDGFAADHTFPTELPEGTGCHRCHGPGAEHVRRALSPEGTDETIRAAIVNPARLAPELRNSVCYECHMEPSVAFPGIRRFGRGDYSFRPGELLDDYRVQLEVTEEGGPPGGRFEINHHHYRLEQSRCFRASGLKIVRAGQGRDDEAISILRAVLAEDPAQVEARVNLGRLLDGAGETEEAVDQLRRVVDLQPNLVAGWEFLGDALLKLDRPADAVDAFERALALEPTRTGSYLKLADALLALDREGEARRYLRHGAVVAKWPEEVRAKLLDLPQRGARR